MAVRAGASVVLGGAGWLVAGGLAVVAAARVVAFDAIAPLQMLNAFALWLFLPIVAVAPLALALRRWRLLAVTVGVLGLWAWWVAPIALARPDAVSEDAAAAPKLRIFSVNILLSNPNSVDILVEAVEAGADIILVQESSGRDRLAMRQRYGDAYPYAASGGGAGSRGLAIYSKLPLTDVDAQALYVAATVTVEGRPLRVIAVHPATPANSEWSAQHAAIRAYAVAQPGAVVLAGDFNMTPFNRPYRQLTGDGFTDAFVARGEGLATTWPNGTRSLPPIRIDHVFTRGGAVALAVATGEGEGSDHKPVIVDIAVLAPD